MDVSVFTSPVLTSVVFIESVFVVPVESESVFLTESILFTHSRYSFSGTTLTLPSMYEWFIPQYSAHSISNTPIFVVWNHIWFVLPGMQSSFVLKAGT